MGALMGIDICVPLRPGDSREPVPCPHCGHIGGFDVTIRWDVMAVTMDVLCAGCHGPVAEVTGSELLAATSRPGWEGIPDLLRFFCSKWDEMATRPHGG